jgi:hypothetical protein
VLAITLLPALSRSAEVPTQAQPQGALWVAGTMATAGALLAACPAQILQPFARQSRPMRSAIWTAAALATPVYVALKGGMAGGGLVAGYWMLLLSFDAHEATGVLDTGRHGDWWIRPEHVTCERPIELIASAQ